MTDVEAFLKRLWQIAAASAPREDDSARAVELFDLFRRRLYARHNICPSKRPALGDKQQVDRALVNLRQVILHAEASGAEINTRSVLTRIRHRIDMTRRALAAQITHESSFESGVAPEPHASGSDRELLSGMRQRSFRNRLLVLNSLAAIRQSRILLAAVAGTSRAGTAGCGRLRPLPQKA